MASSYIKPEKIFLKDHPQFDEKWVQERIAEDPAILGLGELILKDKERIQPRAGRLDLLLQDPESNQRYEVEIQLGKSDESHIIRTIEYWDIERKRYPQYDHCAVIVAENITSRFLNIIGLFNGFIPLIAIQMNAIQVNSQIGMVFTTVMDELQLGLDDDPVETVNRSYWEDKATKNTVALADDILKLIHTFDSDFELKYNKFYIGLAKNGRPLNFVSCRPKKKALNLSIKLDRSEEIQSMFDEANIEMLEYSKPYRQYRIKVNHKDIQKNQDLLKDIMKRAYDAFVGNT